MESINVLPIVIVLEYQSQIESNKIIYQGHQSSFKSILDLSNDKQPNSSPQTFESQRGERCYRNLTLTTLTGKDLAELCQTMDSEKPKTETDVINFISGNPANEIANGIIHFYKQKSLDRVPTRMLAMISVPRSMGIRDVLDFTAPYRDFIDEMKVVKDSTPNEYIILLKFRSFDDADNFYKSFNNVNFNSLEPAVCQLAYVSHVEFLASSCSSTFPLLDLTELPTCPVCLERLDEPLNGTLTIVCNHTFHSKCVQQMNESTCPVCRYPQTPQIMSDKYKCSMCDLREDLWLCLICAHIGCGFHENKHAENHFYQTGHTFAMKIGNKLVWDYAAEAYVHRLVANTSDGKPVEVDSEEPEDKKLSTVCMEYTALLADQLSAQRAYLESEFCQRLSVVEHELDQQTKLAKENEEQWRSVMKDKNMLEKRFNSVSTNLVKLQKKHEEESMMNKSLMERQNHLNSALKAKDEELANLQEQLNDIMININLGSKIAEAQSRGELSQDEINSANISIGAITSNAKNRRTKRK